MYKGFAIAVLIVAPLIVMGVDSFHPRAKEGQQAEQGNAVPAAPAPAPAPVANDYVAPSAPLTVTTPSGIDPTPTTSSSTMTAPAPQPAANNEPPPTGGEPIYVD